MMNTHEELEAAAAAYLEKYLVDNSIYNTKQDATAEGTDAAVTRDQQNDIESGAMARAGSTASAGSKASRKGSWFGGQQHPEEEIMETHKTAGWFKQCRCVVMKCIEGTE